ncbi:hypothetical protein LJC48_03170 [Desulfovibrio sp. OttesenSCG-928-C06]|nr:hypothetical protein [Desulfovibrio sp. OttesenSCG-928-C06]
MSIMGILKSGLDKTQQDYLFNAKDTSQVFAGELSRRISQSSANKVADAAAPDVEAAAKPGADKQAQLQKLESSIKSTVDYIADKHGEKAGTAVMGIMLKRLGEEDITEENLGDAFLDAIRFVDKNFGIEAGDEFMSHLNGSLNDSLNEFFDNGFSEQFIAVTNGKVNAAQTLDTGANSQKVAEQYTDAVLQILKDGRNANESAATDPYARPTDQNALLGVLCDQQV